MSEVLNITYNGIVILEPLTSLTDVITGLTAIICFFLLHRKGVNTPSLIALKFYFLFIGITTLCAGTLGHAFQNYLDPQWKILGWCLSAISIILLEYGSILLIKKHLSKLFLNTILIVIFLKMCILFGLLLSPSSRTFELVQFNSAIGLLFIVFPIHIFSASKLNKRSSNWIIASILWGILTAIIFNFKIGVNIWLDHHGISHLMMTIFIILMYNGVSRVFNEYIANYVEY